MNPLGYAFEHYDDFGRFRAHPSLVKGEIFPYDDDADVAGWLLELVKAGVVVLYTVNGQRYGFVRNFAEHQKIDRRAASRIPPAPGEDREAPATIPSASADPEPTPAAEPAEPAHIPAEPADFTPVDQGAGKGTGNMAPTRAGARARVGRCSSTTTGSSRSMARRFSLKAFRSAICAGFISATAAETASRACLPNEGSSSTPATP